ncbi:MAG TPA: PAS domain S-box protein [Candidatus Limnocylindria bacterium]|nr:PAS domain S-box protein [Candidatus Limnocylindria bacterium]
MNLPHQSLDSVAAGGSPTLPLRILHLEDDDGCHERLSAQLKSDGYQIELIHARSWQQFQVALTQFSFDLIFSDYNSPSFDGTKALNLTQEFHPEVPFLFFSNPITLEQAVETIKAGAADIILKTHLDRVGAAVSGALRREKARSQHRQSQLALKRSESLLNDLIEISVDAIILVDEDQLIRIFNKGAETIFGYRAKEVLGQSLDLLMANRFAEPHRRHLGNFASTPESARVMGDRREIYGRRKDGSEFPAEASISKHQIDGHPVFTAILRDITERKKGEQERLDLLAREQYARQELELLNVQLHEKASLLDKARDAILVRDMGHRITYWNKSAERIYGWAATEATGRPVDSLLKPDPEAFQKAFQEVVLTGEWTGELQKTTKEGRLMTVEARWTLVRDSQGRPSSILDINTDVSQRKKAEQQMLRAQRMESIGTLAGGVAHDLNNVLAPIMMSLGVLHASTEDPEMKVMLGTLESSAKRGADLVKQVLSFARGTNGKRASVNVGQILQDLHQLLRETFLKNIEFSIGSDQSNWNVVGDATQLHQVFLNLCVNARDAMPDGGQLTLTMQNVVLGDVDIKRNPGAKPGPYLRVLVTDTGTGIRPEVIDRIFDPFFTTKRFGEGTGLGLSTTLGIVKGHGGVIDVYSEVGKGTTFIVHLPATPNSNGFESPVEKHLEPPRGHGELVLVVDDEESIRAVVHKTLEQYGYRVITACHGANALAIHAERRNRIAIVLTDMSMPVMDGLALIKSLKSVNPRLKIIGSSGLASNVTVEKVLQAGAELFIPKPYTAETLLASIATVLRPQATSDTTALPAKD